MEILYGQYMKVLYDVAAQG